MMEKYESLIKRIVRPAGNDTSGTFAIYYAAMEDYTEIYTAGIDYYLNDDGSGIYHCEDAMKKFMKTLPKNINIYKVDEKSRLPAKIKFPDCKK